jgi:hypothetical protein
MLARTRPKKGDWEIEKGYEGHQALIGKRYNTSQKKVTCVKTDVAKVDLRQL